MSLSPKSIAAIVSAGLLCSAKAVDFEKEIWPLLRERCVECHGAKKQKGGLRLDGRDFAFHGGKNGPVITAGKPEKSVLVERIVSTDEDEMMPPTGERLTPQQVSLMRAWITAGADWPESIGVKREDAAKAHWAFQPVRRIEVPRGVNPIDHFIAAELAKHDLKLRAEADRRTLIRRVTLDLTGLPPTPEDVERFVREADPRAYETLVDRLLASPHYGERQARHWLDVARFSESDGFEEDMQRKQAWTYRDYVIQAFNDDTPYDQFVREQIAGDVLQPVTPRGIAATGFLVAGSWDALARITPSRLGRLQSREEQLEEMVGAVGQTFLGLTVQCARCHDHKFDPIPQTDYYRMKAVLEGVDHGLAPKKHGLRTMLGEREDAEWQAATKPLREQIGACEKRMAELDKDIKAKGGTAETKAALAVERKQVETERDNAKREMDARFPVTLAYTGDREQPKPTVIFVRGDIRQPGEVVAPGALSAVRELQSDWGLAPDAPEGERRIRFARWVTQPGNPFTARVMVNRLWQQHFGMGIVDTPSDFGVNGGRPSHPELLDWLAGEFVARGWSVKAMHRLIVTSATYRQSSVISRSVISNQIPGSRRDAPITDSPITDYSKDSDNRLLWHFPSRRLEGEVVRDAMLAMSGDLDSRMGGPSFAPFTVTQLNTYFYHLFDKDEPEFNRRSIYRIHVITARSPFLDALDCPSPAVSTPRRRPTTTPLQALALMNDSFAVRQAGKLAHRIAADTPDVTAQIVRAFEIVFSRPPQPGEASACAKVARENGLATVCWTLLNASEFLQLP